jgi:hypothetical protein
LRHRPDPYGLSSNDVLLQRWCYLDALTLLHRDCTG